MLISIVIPTLGRRNCVRDCLDDLDKIEGCDFEVIIVDQGFDVSPLTVNDYSFEVSFFELDIPNASMARNVGLLESKGEIVLFLDDDVRIHNQDILRNHLRHYTDECVSGVFGQVLEVGQATTTAEAPGVFETDWGWMKLPPNYGLPCKTRNGGSGNLSVRKTFAIAVGGMDAWFEKGARREETEFNLRLTKHYGPLIFDPDAGLTHLSAAGGSRSWGRIVRTVPWHHIVGHWYFFLRTICNRTLGLRGLALELRLILIALVKNPSESGNVLELVQNSFRALLGLGIAFSRVARGPRRVSKVNQSLYRRIHK